MQLHWHRRDLRAADNTGLARAADTGAVLPIFVFDGAILEHGSPVRVAFMLDALEALRGWYREHGGELHLARGDPSAVLPALAEAHDAAGVHWNTDYSGLARERDAAVRDALESAGRSVTTHHDDLHHEPGSITTNDGDPYSVYTYFWKKWRKREKEAPHDPPAADQLVGGAGMDAAVAGLSELPTLEDLGFETPAATVEPASTAAARGRLTAFCEGTDDGDERAPIYRYEEGRDYPAEENTSRLSTHLKWGTIGIREVYAATERAMERATTDEEREAVTAFRGELAWREFYTHVLRYNPGVVTEDFKGYENPIEWRDDPEELAAWRAGETGYPIVDAGIRQLHREAWMHNRVRMIVASFLTKDLLADWRHGYELFCEKLADHHTPNDNGGWQWAASTGTDAQPYFRIFNPMTQGERYDPDGEYIREYVPELAGVDADDIHSWHELSRADRRRIAPDYPDPICDHSERREAALSMFRRARGEEE